VKCRSSRSVEARRAARNPGVGVGRPRPRADAVRAVATRPSPWLTTVRSSCPQACGVAADDLVHPAELSARCQDQGGQP
jgi:hypothetical protein